MNVLWSDAQCLRTNYHLTTQLQWIPFTAWITVIYWPSTEPSIKRCTCVNKRKNSGSRWAWHNNKPGVRGGSSQLGTRCQRESQRQPWWERSAAMARRTWGQYSSLSLSPAHLSDSRNITLSRIKWERYIFIKRCIRSFIEVRILCLIMSLLIFVYLLWLYNITLVTWYRHRKLARTEIFQNFWLTLEIIHSQKVCIIFRANKKIL